MKRGRNGKKGNKEGGVKGGCGWQSSNDGRGGARGKELRVLMKEREREGRGEGGREMEWKVLKKALRLTRIFSSKVMLVLFNLKSVHKSEISIKKK